MNDLVKYEEISLIDSYLVNGNEVCYYLFQTHEKGSRSNLVISDASAVRHHEFLIVV